MEREAMEKRSVDERGRDEDIGIDFAVRAIVYARSIPGSSTLRRVYEYLMSMQGIRDGSVDVAYNRFKRLLERIEDYLCDKKVFGSRYDYSYEKNRICEDMKELGLGALNPVLLDKLCRDDRFIEKFYTFLKSYLMPRLEDLRNRLKRVTQEVKELVNDWEKLWNELATYGSEKQE